MTYHKTYTIPEGLLPLVQIGIASGSYAKALTVLYWDFERTAGKGWQVYPVSSPAIGKHDLGDDEQMCIEIDLCSEGVSY